MRKKYIVNILLLVIIIVATSILFYHNDRLSRVKSDMGFRMISANIIQLEGAIMFQMQNNWNEPNNVIEKVEDVIEGIYITRKVSSDLQKLSKEDDEVLLRLIRYFEKLRGNLRDVGWGMNLGYSSDWNELKDKANKLMSM